MQKKDLNRLYEKFVSHIIKHRLNVVVPKLVNDKSHYNVSGLSMLFFYLNLGKIKSKIDLIRFLRQHKCCRFTQPHPRHFGIQYGFHFLVQGSFHPRYRRCLRPGEYCLYSVSKVHPNLQQHKTSHRSVAPNKTSFASLKEDYKNLCAVCGSKEGEPNNKNRTLRTKLEMGHCHPRMPLTLDNCIPMCTYCNHVYKDRFIFNKRGIIVKMTPNSSC